MKILRSLLGRCFQTQTFLILLLTQEAKAAAASRHHPRVNNKQPLGVEMERPALVQEALATNRPLYYFGLGSNMLRSKLENRCVDGKKIKILSMEPAVVPNHRLSFNMRGFVPLEPGMGSLEPVHDDDVVNNCTTTTTSRPLLAYERPECHGALVKLSPQAYEQVMRSEGVGGPNATKAGYEEVIVTAFSYKNKRKPIQAVALRARSHVRLRQDPSPSQRYMDILRKGAAELGLEESYQQFLARHPVQRVPRWLRQVAIHNLIFTVTLSSLLQWRGFSRLQNRILFWVYQPSNAHLVARAWSHVMLTFLLLPGSLLGWSIRTFWSIMRKQYPPSFERLLRFLGEENNNKQHDEEANKNKLAVGR